MSRKCRQQTYSLFRNILEFVNILLQKSAQVVIVIPFETCRTNDRGCKCRKTAGEESPGFIGQDAG